MSAMEIFCRLPSIRLLNGINNWSKRLLLERPQATESTGLEFRIPVVRRVYLLTSSGSLGLGQSHPAQTQVTVES